MDIKVPAVGESVYEAVIARWLKKNGDVVSKDEALCEIETDKITLEVTSEADGVLSITVAEGETVKIGAVIGSIDARGQDAQAAQGGTDSAAAAKPAGKPAAKPEVKPETKPGTAAPMSPSGRKLARELGVEPTAVQGSGRGGRITNEDVIKAQGARADAAEPAKAPTAPAAPAAPAATPKPAAMPEPAQQPKAAAPPVDQSGRVLRKPMSQIRKRIAERLVSVRQHTAMLTTFNEVDMSEVIKLRKKHGEHFQKRHDVKLGFMSLFVRACCAALQEFPDVNASIDGDDIVYHNYCDVGIAVGSERGLVVPVLRSAEKLSLAQIEQSIAGFAEKVRTNRIALADLEGGTFTISNGGIYGSMLSTPILNPPQSGVLGMHNIQERAVVVDGQVVVRPMMYLALSYDHRIVDGQGAVGFLKRVKEYIEDPEEMLLEC
ncbi:2-oxoglutarate dehydrogenase complex dihydrolipoyllysine-residue succinyltransferase [Geomonas agri]|uniref:2-oxoglutarate dehydrogenase complex dihydrolipoyllysine-residue succinyltransferase n=1 Tax=Geomonas agri TaxID=2873702 RepID=UPI001CD640E6|nr:2-oxoglutarate dehydrogenase complex dihydrolipoyllysine-residue succinyltransferase [Geomonas agri]